jgi:hypothetical protein
VWEDISGLDSNDDVGPADEVVGCWPMIVLVMGKFYPKFAI